MAIARVWRGWTLRNGADAFEERVRSHVPKLRENSGFVSMQLLRKDADTETEFVTVTCFRSLDDVKAFAGLDYGRAVIPEPLRNLILRVDEEVKHYSVVEG